MIPAMGESPPFAGIASFLKAPYMADPRSSDAEVAILGIPYDEATTARPGARYGPRAMRDASTNWAYREAATPFYDGEAGAQLLGGVRFVDSGDVDLPPTAQPERSHPLIGARVGRLLEHELFPVVLGGDHSITYPILKAFGRRPLHLVQFDTHMDYWNDESGMLYTHASPIVRSHESGLVQQVTQYGIRGLHTASDQIELARERGVTTFWCEQAKHTPVADLVAHIEPGEDVYITFDIDALDPSIAPGTGTPEPGGFSYYEAKAILRAVALRAHVIGMDMVEVNPLYDPMEITALHAVRLIFDGVGAALQNRQTTTTQPRPGLTAL
jgi:agmatinase